MGKKIQNQDNSQDQVNSDGQDEIKSGNVILHYPSFVFVSINGKIYEGTDIEVDPSMEESVRQHIFQTYNLIAE